MKPNLYKEETKDTVKGKKSSEFKDMNKSNKYSDKECFKSTPIFKNDKLRKKKKMQKMKSNLLLMI